MSAKQSAPKYPLVPAKESNRCSWRNLVVTRIDGKRVTPAAARKTLVHWAETGGEYLNGYVVELPAGKAVIDMTGFWEGDE